MQTDDATTTAPTVLSAHVVKTCDVNACMESDPEPTSDIILEHVQWIVEPLERSEKDRSAPTKKEIETVSERLRDFYRATWAACPTQETAEGRLQDKWKQHRHEIAGALKYCVANEDQCLKASSRDLFSDQLSWLKRSEMRGWQQRHGELPAAMLELKTAGEGVVDAIYRAVGCLGKSDPDLLASMRESIEAEQFVV